MPTLHIIRIIHHTILSNYVGDPEHKLKRLSLAEGLFEVGKILLLQQVVCSRRVWVLTDLHGTACCMLPSRESFRDGLG